MTEQPQGPGWWQASDGKWYPPQNVGAQPSAPPSYQQPSEGIAVTTKFFGFWSPIKPKIFVDGAEIPGVRWGRTVVPAPPGRHHVHVHAPYVFGSRRVGPADTDVEVHAGKQTELEYRLPVWQWSPGALGPAPQPYNGVAISIAVQWLFVLLALAHHYVVRGGLPLLFVLVVAVVVLINNVVLLAQSGMKPRAVQPPGQQPAVGANWYPDPNNPTLMRYFDGRNWTAQTAPRG